MRRRHREPEFDSPFVLDRQKEDLAELKQLNRNPTIVNPIAGVDTQRSEKTVRMMQLPSRNMKLRLLNSIIRKESGLITYTLVTTDKGDHSTVKASADTLPFLKPYRKEMKVNPTMVSFGHRPRSANRTFHPATMQIRLKREQLVKSSAAGKTIGLPESVLVNVMSSKRLNTTYADESHIKEDADVLSEEEESFLEDSFFDDKFNYNLQIKDKDNSSWDGRISAIKKKPVYQSSRRQLLPIAERLTRFQKLHHGIDPDVTSSSPLGRPSQIREKKKCLEEIRIQKLEHARSRIPVVDYRADEFLQRLSNQSALVFKKTEEEATVEDLVRTHLSPPPKDSSNHCFHKSVSIQRVYSTADGKKITGSVNSAPLIKTAAARLEGNVGTLQFTRRCSADAPSLEKTGSLAAHLDPLFDHVMQSQGRSSVLAYEDADLVDYLEYKLSKESVLKSTKLPDSSSIDVVHKSRRDSKQLRQQEDNNKLLNGSLYINRSFDFNKSEHVTELKREVHNQELALHDKLKKTAINRDDSLDSGSVIDENNMRAIASEIFLVASEVQPNSSLTPSTVFAAQESISDPATDTNNMDMDYEREAEDINESL